MVMEGRQACVAINHCYRSVSHSQTYIDCNTHTVEEDKKKNHHHDHHQGCRYIEKVGRQEVK